MPMRNVIFALALAIIASGCSHKDTAAEKTTEVSVSSTSTEPALSDATPDAAAIATPVSADFSIDSVPISNAPLGKFPFFAWPSAYLPQNAPTQIDFGHFLFWTGKALTNVEGKTFLVTLVAAPNTQFSSYELKRNMEALFNRAGGVKISDAKIPSDVLHSIPNNVIQEILPGLGDAYNDPVETWVIHRPHDAVWINYSTNSSQSSLAVVQTKPFVPTAALLPADALKSSLDASGKAVIHVNFATDQTQILPTSNHQIDAVIALLKANPSLKLAINGYTDDTGSDAHNVELSDGRAKAVKAMLVSGGIAVDRLQSKGFGRMSPLSSNADEAGKAVNRRVELVKL